MKEKKREKSKDKVLEQTDEAAVETSASKQQEIIKTQEQECTPEVVIEGSSISVTEAGEEEEEDTSVVTSDEALEVSVPIMPPWGSPEESEWMYGIPPREEDKALWAEEWSDYLLQWAEQKEIHLLSLSVFISEPPFKDLRNKVDSFKIIAQILIDKEVAEWSDKRARQLRVYWKPLEDWADIIYEWSLRTGKLRLDVKSIVIQESKEAFAKLPEKDLFVVMALMVEKGFAEWIDKKKGAVLIST